jgi:hypothetical protein
MHTIVNYFLCLQIEIYQSYVVPILTASLNNQQKKSKCICKFPNRIIEQEIYQQRRILIFHQDIETISGLVHA